MMQIYSLVPMSIHNCL